MKTVRGVAGALALLAAGFVAPSTAMVPHGEPLAAALAPLGPLKSLASAFLWQRLLTAQMQAQTDRTAAFGRALLELHPDLQEVREYVANQLVVTEATRAPDLLRHDRLVATGLALLGDGLALRETSELHGALGRLLAVQRDRDPDFRAAAEAWLGDELDATAIFHLRRSAGTMEDRLLLASLLLDHGEAEVRDGDLWAARRDWQEAREALAPLQALDHESVDVRLAGLARQLIDRGIGPEDVGPAPGRR